MKRLIPMLLAMFVFVWLLRKWGEQEDANNANLYVIKSHAGDIMCNHHDSRDTTDDGYMRYTDYSTKREHFIRVALIDSIIVLKESFWSCGPRGNNIKYIDKRKRR